MCCHICLFNTVSKGPEGRPKKVSHWSQCHSVDTRLFCCRCATSASKNVVTRSGRCSILDNAQYWTMLNIGSNHLISQTGWNRCNLYVFILDTVVMRACCICPLQQHPLV